MMTTAQQNTKHVRAMVKFKKAIMSSQPARMADQQISSLESMKTIPPAAQPKDVRISVGGLEGKAE